MHRRKDAIPDTYRSQRASTAAAAIAEVRRILRPKSRTKRGTIFASAATIKKIHYILHGAMFPVTMTSNLIYQLFLDSDLRYFCGYFLRPSAVARRGSKRGMI
jgi:hypothetical protein